MPSPVGHFIGGVAAGWLVSGSPPRLSPKTWGGREWREAVLYGALGMVPDLDLLFGGHREATHSIGAAFIVGMVAWAVSRGGRLRFGCACMLAYASHILLDWLATDTSSPIGVMALWPFTSRYFESNLHLFWAISRRYYHPWSFVAQNTLALGRELIILLPVLVLIMSLRRRPPEGTRA